MNPAPTATSPRLGFWLLISLIALFAGSKPILFDTLDPDCFWHLRVAEQLCRDGIGPIVDDLSFSSIKQPWTPYSWLAELVMKTIWDTGGYRAAVATTALMQALIIFLLAATCREAVMRGSLLFLAGPSSGAVRKGTDPLLAGYLSVGVATAVGAFLILPYLSFRPVTMGFVLLFSAAWLIAHDLRISWIEVRYGVDPVVDAMVDTVVEGGRFPIHPKSAGPCGNRLVWCVVPLTALLTNIHLFSFFVPAMVLAMAAGALWQGDSRNARRYSVLATATSLACLATPMLPGLIRTLLFYSAQDKMVTGPVIAEMQFFARGPLGFIAGAGVIGMLACILRQYHRVPVGQLLCVGAATLLLLKLGRFAPIFALAVCPALAVTLPELNDRLLGKRVIIMALSVVLILSIARVIGAFPSRSVTLPAWINRHGPDTPGYPCAAADYVEHSVTRSTGHLINEFSWGGYLAWRLGDKFQVLLDGRTQVFPQKLWQSTYLGSEMDRQKFLSTIHADAALLPLGKSKFHDALIHLGWTSVYRDDRSEVLIPSAATAALE